MKNFIIFPFLLAFFPSWIIISKNFEQLIFQDILISLAIIAMSVIVWVVITKIIKNGNKAALITGVGVGFFFYFGYVQDALKGIIIFGVQIDRTSITVTASIIIFIISTIYFIRSRNNFEAAIKIANTFAIILILFTLVQFVMPDALAEKPNVYHIILDEYTDNEILMKKLNYDNEKFLKFLNKNGFYIPNKSFSTWEHTVDEFGSILNMEYQQIKTGTVIDPHHLKGSKKAIFSWNYELVNDNKVMSIFSDQNYSIIEINSMSRWKDYSYVDTKLCYGGLLNINSEFLDHVLAKSIIRYFLEIHHNDTRGDVIRCASNELNEIASQNSGPKYVFAHIIAPHLPFLFGPNGENVMPDNRKISGLQSYEDPQGYVNQLIYVTNQVSVVIKNIVKNDPDAIIILQGDTGTFTGIDDIAKREVKDVYQSHSILYAVRIPDVDNLESMIPVNTYRIIFNNYFNMNYEYLEQRIFTIFEDRVWVEVTEKFHKYRFD